MNTPTIIILIGITGDLSRRKLLPALEGLQEKGKLPEHFKLVGITRHDNDQGYFKMDLDNAEDYKRLAEYLDSIEKEWNTKAQRLFYLSVAPTVSLPIIKHLGEGGLSTVGDAKLLLEKPFGLDEANAKEVIENIKNYFNDDQVYRIDHYLGKNTVRSLANESIDPSIVERIEVVATESIAIEGRAHFYEQTGALRDFIQSHLLQVAALALDPKNRLALLQELSVQEPIAGHVKRGQYNGYREAAENPTSTVETFVSVELQSQGPLFTGTVVLKTGKALDRKSTDLTLFYKDGASKVISLHDSQNAYENVFYDAIIGDKTFFVTPEEVLQTWHILAPIQEAWKKDSSDLFFYEPGSIL